MFSIFYYPNIKIITFGVAQITTLLISSYAFCSVRGGFEFKNTSFCNNSSG